MSKKIVVASSNQGKVREIQNLLKQFLIIPQTDFNIPSAEETGLTFVENAIIKARQAAEYSGFPVIADDSGLEVDALGLAPGIYSSRYAGQNASDAENIVKLLHNLRSVPTHERTARFHCVLVYLRTANDPCPIIAQASWEGRILGEPRGENGFGYDPVFFAPESQTSAAELSEEDKNRYSHRGKALRLLCYLLEKQQSERENN